MPIQFSRTLMQRSRCSYEEQLSLFPLIETCVSMITICRNYGTLALEEMIWHSSSMSLHHRLPHDQYQTLQFILLHVLDGREPKIIQELGLLYISKRKKGKSLLQDMIILESAICFVYRNSVYDTRFFLHRLLDDPLNHPDTAARMWMNQKREVPMEG